LRNEHPTKSFEAYPILELGVVGLLEVKSKILQVPITLLVRFALACDGQKSFTKIGIVYEYSCLRMM